MKKSTQERITLQRPFSDFAMSYNNGIWAVYVIGRDPLEVEDRKDLLKVPFLVWDNSWNGITDISAARRLGKAPYIENQRFEDLVFSQLLRDKRVVYPESVTVNGVKYSMDDLASNYVPFSFGVGHPYDEEDHRRVRTLDEFEDFASRVVPRVLEIRNARREQVQKDNSILNKILTRFRMYTPAEFGGDQPYY